MEFNAAAKLQHWWRERDSKIKRPFKFGIFELVKMLDKVLRIQRWWRYYQKSKLWREIW